MREILKERGIQDPNAELERKGKEGNRRTVVNIIFGGSRVMTPEQKAGFDGEFLMAMAEKPNEILKCAMYLFAGYLDGAIQFAKGSGGGPASDLPWGRDPKEDDRRFAYRCMMQAHKMLKPICPKRGVCGKR